MIFLAVKVAQGRHSQEKKAALDLKIWSMLVVALARRVCQMLFSTGEVAQGKHFQEKKAVWNVKIIWSFMAKEMRLSGI